MKLNAYLKLIITTRILHKSVENTKKNTLLFTLNFKVKNKNGFKADEELLSSTFNYNGRLLQKGKKQKKKQL
jgi:hypothetical protein